MIVPTGTYYLPALLILPTNKTSSLIINNYARHVLLVVLPEQVAHDATLNDSNSILFVAIFEEERVVITNSYNKVYYRTKVKAKGIDIRN